MSDGGERTEDAPASTLAFRDWHFSVDQEGIGWAIFDREGAERQRPRNAPPARAVGHRRLGRGRRAPPHDVRPRHPLRQGEGLYRRRRHQRVRRLRDGSPRCSTASAWYSPCSTASSGCQIPVVCRHPRRLRRRRLGARARLPLPHRHPRCRRRKARLPRGQARHLPGLQRHRTLDPPSRPRGRHARRC